MNLFAPKSILPAPVYAATLSDNGERIVLRGRMSPVVKEWIPCLPGARWVGAKLCWTMDATPACAWRLLGHAPFKVEPDVAVLALSARFLPAPGSLPASQPPLRVADLRKHQIEPYHFSDAREGSLLSMWMGTGKSKVAVDLAVNRGCRRILVVCPVSVLGVWRREFAKWAAVPVEVLVLDKPWSVAKKAEAAAEFVRAHGGLRGRPCAVVVNYETAWRAPFGEWSLSVPWDAVVGDEIHRAKGHGTAQGKHMGALSKVGGLRLGLSGTAMDHSPLDLFGVARFVDRGIFGTSFHAFRNRYARMDEFVPGKVEQWLNMDELRERLALFAVHVGEEVLDLPPVQHIERTVALGSKTMKAYLGLETEMIAEIEGWGEVVPPNAMVRLLRLQQLTSGFVGGVEDPDGNKVLAVLGEEKRELLGDILLDLPEREPVVVFCRFTQDLKAVRGLAEVLGRRYGELSGNQHDLTPTAEMPEGIDVYGVQIKSGGVGVDLTRSCYCVYYSVGFSLGDFLQSLSRLQRPGQRRSVRAYHLMADGTVDFAVYGALRARHDLIEAVLSVLKKGKVRDV